MTCLYKRKNSYENVREDRMVNFRTNSIYFTKVQCKTMAQNPIKLRNINKQRLQQKSVLRQKMVGRKYYKRVFESDRNVLKFCL